MELPVNFIDPYISYNPPLHELYGKTVEMKDELEVHAKGLTPKKLIEERRPAETQKIRDYREKIYVPITQATWNKVISSLRKISKAQDWAVKFPEDRPAIIQEGESLKEYLMYNFPRYDSVVNWLFTSCLPNYCVDANAVAIIMPTKFDVEDTEYVKPYPYIFGSDQIIDYKHNEYYLVKSKDTNPYTEGGITYKGFIYYAITTTHIYRYVQVKKDLSYVRDLEYENGLGYLPVVGLYGLVEDETESTILYRSRLATMQPGLDEAAREYSDLQAEVVQHIHSTMWAYDAQDCGPCRGSGWIIKDDGVSIVCPGCQGKGVMAFNPYEFITIKNAEPGQPASPTPPVGYVTKDTNIITVQDQRVRQHLYSALQSINFEFLAQTPLEQSGVAKQFDREEMQNTVFGIAYDLVRITNQVNYIITDYRYRLVVPNPEERYKMLPTIQVPVKYDMIGEDVLLQGIASMRASGMDQSIINAAMVEYVSKKFNSDPMIAKRLEARLNVDPLSGITEDDILARLASGTIKREDAVIHSNIKALIDRAEEELEGFYDLTKIEQYEILLNYAREGITPDANA